MARLVNVRNESNIYDSITQNIHNRLGNFYSGKDATINTVSEVLSKEIINLKRENERLFEAMQLSNATNLDLDNLAFDMYGLSRLSETYSRVAYNENNLHFYVTSGSFGDINGGSSITIPKGTLISTQDSFLDDTDEPIPPSLEPIKSRILISQCLSNASFVSELKITPLDINRFNLSNL